MWFLDIVVFVRLEMTLYRFTAHGKPVTNKLINPLYLQLVHKATCGLTSWNTLRRRFRAEATWIPWILYLWRLAKPLVCPTPRVAPWTTTQTNWSAFSSTGMQTTMAWTLNTGTTMYRTTREPVLRDKHKLVRKASLNLYERRAGACVKSEYA